MEFNINEEVKVRLTDLGRALHKQDHEAFWTENRRPDLVASYKPPVEDAEGWSTWQLWALMEKFGAHIGIGFDVPFEPTIVLVGAADRSAGLEEAARIVEGGAFLHDASPAAQFAKEAATAIRRAIR